MKIRHLETMCESFRLKNPVLPIAAIASGFLFLNQPEIIASVHYPLEIAKESSLLQQKGKTVKVTVTDGKESLIGANVTVKGTTIGSVTDIDGKVELKDIPENSILVVSYIGYAKQEIPVGNQQAIAVKLSENTNALNEVVVVGYGTLEKKQVTNAITSISAKDMLVGVGGADISTALQGKISGLVMYNQGSPNSGTTFQLRGMSSLNAGKAPLIVIDGFPDGDIRSLDQNDIKSIDVLKDASAGSIYGTRAASGVILITTKSGTNTNGKVKLHYSAEFSHKQDFGAPEMLSASEFLEHGISKDYGSDVDWWDELTNDDNFSQKHHLSLEAGNEKSQLRISFNYSKNEGITYNDERQDYGGRFTAKFKLLDDWLEISPNLSYRQAKRNNHRPNYQQALSNNPTRSPYDPDSKTGYNVWLNESLDMNTLADAMLYHYDGLDKWFKPEVRIKLNIKPVSGLSYEQTIGYENRQWEPHSYQPSYARDELENSRKGTASLGFNKDERITSQGIFTYLKEFKGGHLLNAVAGFDYSEKNNENFSATNYNFATEDTEYWDLGKGTYLGDGKAGMASNKGATERLFAWLARVNYTFKDKYVLQASIRYEGSSKFAEDNRWAAFPSVSAAWRISNEKFMKDIPWLEELKLRAGYGAVGNNNFNATYMADLLGSDAYWMMPDGQWAYTYGRTQNVNPELGWEKTKEWDMGFDYSLFKGRLYGKFDYYIKNTDDLLLDVQVPQPPYTIGTQWRNIGKMKTQGWEFEIGGDIISTKDFKWTSNMNLSHESGKIKTLYGDNTYKNGNGFPAPGSPGDAARIQEGSEIGSFYIWKFAGFDDAGGFLLYNKEGKVIPAKEKTENDKRYIGNYKPSLIIGWNHTLTYKNWDLGINLRSWLNFDVYNAIDMYYGIQGQGNTNVLKAAYGKYNQIKGEKQICDYYLDDGSFLKIDAITLGYTLPMKKYTKLIESVRLYGTVGNVCTITGYDGMNPEVDVTGWDQGTEKFWDANKFYPNVRTYTLGLNINF